MPVPVFWLLIRIAEFYELVVVLAVATSWLIAFGVLNLHNQFVRRIVQILDALTEPLFRQIRRIVPPIGGLDLSPLVVIFGLEFLQAMINWTANRYAF
jgi:YggT family protein